MRILKWVLASVSLLGGVVHAGTVVVSGGTSMVQGVRGEERAPSSIQVSCASVNRTSIGYLCGFDDGEHSVMQFEERSDGQVVRFFDASNQEITGVKKIGNYYVFPKIYPMVFARVGGKEAILMRSQDKRIVDAAQLATKGNSGAAGTVAAAVAGAPAEAAAPAQPMRVLVIREGERYDLALEAAAKVEGWKFRWYPKRSWTAPADIDLSQYRDVTEAVIDIIDGLHEEGRPVKWRISDGNKIIDVLSTEVRND